MYPLLILFFLIQQWISPIRISPDSSYDTHPSICIEEVGEVWVYWYNSNHLWTRCYNPYVGWSEVFLIDTTKCKIPQVTTSSACKGTYEIPDWIIAWVDSSGFVRLTLSDMMPPVSWWTIPPDSRIEGYDPAIAYDRDSIILWCMWTANGLYLASHCEWGNWAVPDTLKEFTPVEITYTTGITIDNEGNVWVCYNDHESIWVQYWNGNNWSTPESIGTCFDYAYPTMCADSSSIWVAWFNSSYYQGIGAIFMRYHDGLEWSNLIEFPHYFDTTDGGHNSHPDICSDEQGRLWAVWHEEEAIYTPNYRILASVYNETSWSNIEVVDSCYGALGGKPSIAYRDDKVWIVWQSEKEGDYNIYGSYNEITGVEDAMSLYLDFKLLRNYPNPFRERTVITLECINRVDAAVTWSQHSIHIYDISGSLIRTLPLNLCNPNESVQSVYWDGKDELGSKVGSGVYFYQLKVADELKITRKMLILK